MQDGPAFRHATSEVTVQPSPCLSYRIPRDFVELSTGEDAYKLIDFLKLVISFLPKLAAVAIFALSFASQRS